MVVLESANLTSLGGPMGTERTWINWTRYYLNVKSAKKAAEGDFGRTFKWVLDKNVWRSPDLGRVMYHIRDVKVER